MERRADRADIIGTDVRIMNDGCWRPYNGRSMHIPGRNGRPVILSRGLRFRRPLQIVHGPLIIGRGWRRADRNRRPDHRCVMYRYVLLGHSRIRNLRGLPRTDALRQPLHRSIIVGRGRGRQRYRGPCNGRRFIIKSGYRPDWYRWQCDLRLIIYPETWLGHNYTCLMWRALAQLSHRTLLTIHLHI